MRPRELLPRAQQLVVEAAQRLRYWTNRWRRLLRPGGFVRREVEDGPRHGVDGRGGNVRRFGLLLCWRLRSLADVLAVTRVGRRGEAAPAVPRVHLTVARLVLVPPALSLILPRPRVSAGLRSRHLLPPVLAAAPAAAPAGPAAAAGVAGLHLAVVRLGVVRRPPGPA